MMCSPRAMVFVLGVFAVAGPLAAQVQTPQPPAQTQQPDQPAASRQRTDLETAADEAYRAGRFQDAANLYMMLRARDPGNPRALIGLAESLRRLGRDAEALDIYQEYKATREGQLDWRTYNGMGQIYLNSKYYQLALTELKEASQRNQVEPEIWVGLAQAYRGLREIDKAIEAARRAQAQAPEDIGVLVLLADLLRENQDFAEALVLTGKTVRLKLQEYQNNPGDARIIQELISLYDMHVKTLQQVISLRRFEGRQPVGDLFVRLVEALDDLAILNMTLQRYVALNAALNGLQDNPDHVPLLLRTAQLQARLNLIDDAIRTVQRILSINPHDPDARRLMAQLQQAKQAGQKPGEQITGQP